jgi:hypothetical protein
VSGVAEFGSENEDVEPERARREFLARPLEPGDSYMEGPFLVFTAQYHLRRGYCCQSDCRHCPYKESSVDGFAPGGFAG